MKRFWAALVVALLLCGGAGAAWGQAAPPAEGGGAGKTKFYNFDDMLIDGEIKKPSGLLTNTRDQVRFRRLLSLKRSFLPKLKRTAKERSLK